MKLLFAQIAENPLYAYGPLGIICAWLMWQGKELSKDIKTLAHRIDGLTRAMLMDMVNRDSTGPVTKAAAREALAKIEARSQE